MAFDKIPATYVGPVPRWALLREDHPEADVAYSTVKAADSGVPPEFLSDTELFVRAVITTNDGEYIGDKEVPRFEKRNGSRVAVDLNPELFVKLRSQALGRALKSAGYPDDADDLRMLLNWRRGNRTAPEAQLPAAPEVPALPPAKPQQIAATVRPPDEPSDREPVDSDSDIADAEIVSESSGSAVERLKLKLESMPGSAKVALARQAKDNGIMNLAAATEEQAALVLSW